MSQDWKTEKFLQAVENRTLGRKSQFGSYFIKWFDTCGVLMFKPVDRNEQLQAILLSNNITLWNSGYSHAWKSRGKRVDVALQLDLNSIFEGLDITDAGVVDAVPIQIGSNERWAAVIDVEGNHFLLDYVPQQCTREEYLNLYSIPEKAALKFIKFNERAGTVQEARDFVAPRGKNLYCCYGYWVEEMNDAFTPDFAPKSLIETVSNRPHPHHFGVPEAFWRDLDSYREPNLKSIPPQVAAAAKKYLEEKEKWTNAREEFKKEYSIHGFPGYLGVSTDFPQVGRKGNDWYFKGVLKTSIYSKVEIFRTSGKWCRVAQIHGVPVE